jgi:hypothetical protein
MLLFETCGINAYADKKHKTEVGECRKASHRLGVPVVQIQKKLSGLI